MISAGLLPQALPQSYGTSESQGSNPSTDTTGHSRVHINSTPDQSVCHERNRILCSLCLDRTGRWTYLWAGQKDVSTVQDPRCDASHALWNIQGATDDIPGVGFDWTAQHRLRRAGQSDDPAERGSTGTPDVGDSAGSTASPSPSRMVARLLSFTRPHTSLRVARGQPKGRGGQRIAQRYRQRTPAMAAGRTRWRWTVRELLLFVLPPPPVGMG